jgi:hypothetical protein
MQGFQESRAEEKKNQQGDECDAAFTQDNPGSAGGLNVFERRYEERNVAQRVGDQYQQNRDG